MVRIYHTNLGIAKTRPWPGFAIEEVRPNPARVVVRCMVRPRNLGYFSNRNPVSRLYAWDILYFLSYKYKNVGTGSKRNLSKGLVAQWLACRSCTLEIEGSILVDSIISIILPGKVGKGMQGSVRQKKWKGFKPPAGFEHTSSGMLAMRSAD